MIDWYTNKKL